MNVEKLSEYGYNESALGFSLSYNSRPERAKQIFQKYAFGVPGEGKFLESIVTFWDIDAPRFWWSEFDTYRVGVTKQSESTMHTITKRLLAQDDFELPIPDNFLVVLNNLVKEIQVCKDLDLKNVMFLALKNNLPEGFLQRRIVLISYKSLQNIIYQREKHRLPQWKFFCDSVLSSVEHPAFLKEEA